MALREIHLNRSIAGTDETEKSHGELPTEAVTHRSRPLRSSEIATADAGTIAATASGTSDSTAMDVISRLEAAPAIGCYRLAVTSFLSKRNPPR
jgi:hypothetical protein